MRRAALISLILWASQLMAKPGGTISRLFDKQWHAEKYELNAQTVTIKENDRKDYLVFYKNHTAESVKAGGIKLSKWKFRKKKNTLKVVTKESKEKSSMKIITLSDDQFIWETTIPEGVSMVIYMVPQ